MRLDPFIERDGKRIGFRNPQRGSERARYDALSSFLRQTRGVTLGEEVTAPWADYRAGAIDGNAFVLFFDLDEDEVSLRAQGADVIQALYNRLIKSTLG